MAYVYILHSSSANNFYIGSCKDLKARLIEHQTHTYPNSFTSRATDWKLFLVIDNLMYLQSRNIEKHIKRMKSKTFIKNLKKYPELILKLKIKY
jgi:putative endonuclease